MIESDKIIPFLSAKVQYVLVSLLIFNIKLMLSLGSQSVK